MESLKYKNMKWRISKFPSGKTQAHTLGDSFVIWADPKNFCVRSNFVKLKDKCFPKLPQAKKYVRRYLEN